MVAAQEQQRRVKKTTNPSFLPSFAVLRPHLRERSPFVTKVQQSFVADY
jgi:hypothetical protein